MRFAGQRGASLVEVLVSLGLFGVGMTAILPMFLYASTQQRHQDDLEIAYELMVGEFERLNAVPYAELPDAIAATEVLHASGQRYVVSVDLDAGHDDATWEDDDEELDYNLTRLTVDVRWQSLGPRTQRASLAQFRLKG